MSCKGCGKKAGLGIASSEQREPTAPPAQNPVTVQAPQPNAPQRGQ